MKMCQLCQNVNKVKQPNLERPESNPCFVQQGYREEHRGIPITCCHCSYISSAKIVITKGKK